MRRFPHGSLWVPGICLPICLPLALCRRGSWFRLVFAPHGCALWRQVLQLALYWLAWILLCIRVGIVTICVHIVCSWSVWLAARLSFVVGDFVCIFASFVRHRWCIAWRLARLPWKTHLFRGAHRPMYPSNFGLSLLPSFPILINRMNSYVTPPSYSLVRRMSLSIFPKASGEANSISFCASPLYLCVYHL